MSEAVRTYETFNRVCHYFTPMTKRSGHGPVTSVEKTLGIFELLRETDTATTSTIAAELDVAKSTAHRHLKTLERWEYVTLEEDGCSLSFKFLDLGTTVRRRETAYVLAKEKVEELARETGERAQFLIEEHGRAVYVHLATGEHAVEADTYPGLRVPIHASAAGLAILSALPREDVDAIVDRHGLEPLTPHTITNRERLYEVLEAAREREYSINDRGYIQGLRAIGAPVRNAGGDVLGGISISGPSNRMQGGRFESELPSLLLGATNELELNIAYR